MKYARVVGGFLIDVYEVPSAQFPSLEHLNKCLPGGGFIEVPSDAVHSAKDNGDGTYTNPSGASVPKPVVFRTGKDMALQLITWLGGNGAARAALGAIVKACQGSANGADNFFAYYLTLENFTKAEFLAVLNAVDNSIVSANQKTFVAANWPEA